MQARRRGAIAATASRRKFSANLLHADLIVLNKADLAGREATAAAQRLLASLAPQARVSSGVRAAVSRLPLLLGPALRTPQDRTVTTTRDPDCRAMRDSRPPDLIGEHCRSWSIFSDEPIAGKEFRRWVSRLPPFILRALGACFCGKNGSIDMSFLI